LLVIAACAAGRPAPAPPLVPQGTTLRVVAAETPDAVHLRIPPSPDIDPGSVEVRLDGRQLTVLARTASGEQVRSETLTFHEPPVEEGATADYEPDGWLAITLRKSRRSVARSMLGRGSARSTPR
jgi:HSP20 family molecular chaperone IbpA